MNKLTPAIIVSLVLGLALGYAWGYLSNKASYAPKIEAVNRIFPPTVRSTSIGGKVKQITTSSVTLEGVQVSMNPFAADYPTTREVTITSDTRITKLTRKDPAEFQKEMVDFQKSMQSKTPGVPPAPFTETEITLADIKVGDSVNATAATDIISAATFTATQIQLSNVGLR